MTSYDMQLLYWCRTVYLINDINTNTFCKVHCLWPSCATFDLCIFIVLLCSKRSPEVWEECMCTGTPVVWCASSGSRAKLLLVETQKSFNSSVPHGLFKVYALHGYTVLYVAPDGLSRWQSRTVTSLSLQVVLVLEESKACPFSVVLHRQQWLSKNSCLCMPRSQMCCTYISGILLQFLLKYSSTAGVANLPNSGMASSYWHAVEACTISSKLDMIWSRSPTDFDNWPAAALKAFLTWNWQGCIAGESGNVVLIAEISVKSLSTTTTLGLAVSGFPCTNVANSCETTCCCSDATNA